MRMSKPSRSEASIRTCARAPTRCVPTSHKRTGWPCHSSCMQQISPTGEVDLPGVFRGRNPHCKPVPRAWGDKGHSVCNILPNLPGKQFVICGGQAWASWQRLARRWSRMVVHLLQAMSDRILVTLSSCGEGGLCRRLSSGLRKGGELDHVVRVDVATGPGRATRSSKLRRSTDGSVSLRSARRRPAHTQ